MTITVAAASMSAPAVPIPARAAPPRWPRWPRAALAGLLLATAALYLWGLGASGWANSYYSAAAQAGATNWKALFYGSLDGGSAITVDKTPASLWLMAASVRLFGLSSWSILVPQAVAGVAAVGLLYAAVRRWFGPAAGLLAGAVLATTPVATLMFRFNNPDALLVLLLVGAAYATVRAIERAGTRWLVLAGVLVGFGFLTKMLQAFLVLPALAGAYLLAAPVPVRRRLGQLTAAGAALVASAGWWVAIVALVPARYRPYIGGSQSNSILELTIGYNGLGRLTGSETGSVGGGRGWGQTGWTRLFAADIGGQVAWLLPAALILLVGTLWTVRRAPRTDRPVWAAGGGTAAGQTGRRTRAALLLWGGWLLVTALVFSFMRGIFHAYYTVALAPAIGALVGIGSVALWRSRRERFAAAVLAAAVAATAIWSYVLLSRSAGWHPWLRTTILVAGLAAAAALLVADRLPRTTAGALTAVAPAAVALAVGLAGPVAYSLNTAATPHLGAIPSAGPAVAGAPGGAPGGPGGLPPRGPRVLVPGAPGSVAGGPAGGAAGGPGLVAAGPGGGPGNIGGLLNGSTPSAELVWLLQAGSGSYTWVAAAVGANNAAGYQLASGLPVMAVGGFNGSDPSPTLAQFQGYVRLGRIHYFVGGSGPRGDSGSNEAQQIAAWVAQNFTATTVGGTTVYDLSAGAVRS
jgi:4-amino-4-deoxy-L-arabinose transferase-like glycosyltransferase